MCFSATASFVAGATLTAVGVATLKEVKTKNQIPFASIPLIFGIQQIIEGGVWLSLKYGLPFLNQIASYSFIFFAYIFWPIFIPFAIGLLENDPLRKKIIIFFQYIGIFTALYLSYFIIYYPITSQVVNKCIAYSAPQNYGFFLMAMYISATCVSCLFSSHRLINIFGILMTLFFAITLYFYIFAFVSVWCFFAAVLSMLVYLYFRELRGKFFQK